MSKMPGDPLGLHAIGDAGRPCDAAGMTLRCHHCKQPVVQGVGSILGFRETCSACSADLHACLNCSFYDAAAYRECREPQAEWVKDKEKWNRCEYFRGSAQDGSSEGSSRADKLAALDALFKK